MMTIRSLVTNGGWGSGSGRGGGSGGSIRDAGGSFGRMEAAREEEYFRKLQAEQIQKLKERINKEIDHQKESISDLEKEIEIAKKKIKELDDKKSGFDQEERLDDEHPNEPEANYKDYDKDL